MYSIGFSRQESPKLVIVTIDRPELIGNREIALNLVIPANKQVLYQKKVIPNMVNLKC